MTKFILQSDNQSHLDNNNINDIENDSVTSLPDSGRRRFLQGAGMGAMAVGVSGLLPNTSHAELVDFSTELSSNRSFNTAQNTFYNQPAYEWPQDSWQQDSWQQPATPSFQCTTASIATRLFSSSNASTAPDRNDLAIQRLTCAGFHVENPDVMSRKYYRFGGTDKQRADDFNDIANGRVSAPKLLLGVRGGYGAMRILPTVNWQRLGRVMRERGTILGGFSDVTAIQCALLAKGSMGSANLPMAYSEFGKYQPDPISCAGFVKAISNKNLILNTSDSSRTSSGLPLIMGNPRSRIKGTIWGGNLSVLSSLSGSEYMPNPRGGLVFIEEVGEQPYRLERMLYDMYLTGAFNNQQAIIFGAMARSGKDGYDPSYDVSAVIRQLHRLTGLPIYNGVGFGHVSKKQSFPMGCECELITTGYGFDMKFSGYPTVDAQINESALSMQI